MPVWGGKSSSFPRVEQWPDGTIMVDGTVVRGVISYKIKAEKNTATRLSLELVCGQYIQHEGDPPLDSLVNDGVRRWVLVN